MSETLRAVRLGEGCVDLTVADGRIARITPHAGPASGLVLPLLVDAHVHLDKTYVAHRLRARPSMLMEAIDLSAADKARWSEADIRARAARALDRIEANGIGALRTHVDWLERARPRAWDVIGALARERRGRIRIERAALLPLDLIGDAEAGPDLAAEIAAEGGVLGTFVYRNAELEAKLARVFALAVRHDLPLDFHVDEGLDPEARGFDAIIALTARHRLGGRVLCGHGCALSVRPEAEVARLLDAAAAAGVALTVLPTTNLWLQDARPGRTPRLRGIAPMQEARAAGMAVLVGLDNVCDAFYPYGDYDLLDAWRLACLTGHLDPEAWIDAVTALPARATGLAPPGLREGGPADFIHLCVPSLDALVSQPRAARTVWRDGRPLGAPSRERVSA